MTGEVACSAPPTTITSASPYWMARIPKPILCVPVVHAVTTARLGPRKSYIIDNLPEIMLMMLDGTKNGDTRPGPRSRHVEWVSSMVLMPPIPEPMATPILSPWLPSSTAGVPYGLDPGDQPILDEAVEASRFLAIQVVLDGETLDRRTDRDALAGGIEFGDGCGAANARKGVAPAFVHGIADGRQHAESCYRDSPCAHNRGPRVAGPVRTRRAPRRDVR